MNFYLFLAGSVLAIHLIFILWTVVGWLLTRRRPLWRSIHIACVIYGIFIEASGLSCPLTLAEWRLEERGGMAATHEPFILHYLELLVYPNILVRALVPGAVIVCAGILAIYLWRYRHRDARGW